MNEYRLKDTGQIVTDQEYRDVIHPNKSHPQVLTPDDADVIFITPSPEVSDSQMALRDGVVQDSLGNWVYAWKIVNKETSQVAAELLAHKLAKAIEINMWRGEANSSSFPHLGKTIACDALSRSDIDAVAGSISLTGNFPSGFPNAWKAMDNTYLPLPTVQDFKDMYNSMTAQGTLNFNKAQALKVALIAATTIEEVNNITWN